MEKRVAQLLKVLARVAHGNQYNKIHRDMQAQCGLKKRHVQNALRGSKTLWVVPPPSYERVTRLKKKDLRMFEMDQVKGANTVLTTGDGPGVGDPWLLVSQTMERLLSKNLSFVSTSETGPPRYRASKFDPGYQAQALDGTVWVVTKQANGRKTWTPMRSHRSWKKSSRRKAPKESATQFTVNTKRKGCDGNMWVIRRRSSGKYWAKCKSS